MVLSSSPLNIAVSIVKRKRFWIALVLAAIMASASYLHYKGYYSLADAITLLEAHPIAAPAIFIVLYAVLSVLMLPTLPLNLAAGMLWGWAWGTVLSLFGVVMGASIAFFIARYVGHDFIEKHLQGKHWQMLWRLIESYNWKAVAFARINPVFPSAPLNYFFGLTNISFAHYFFSTLLFILPPSLFFAVIGDSVGGFVLEGSTKDLVNNVLIASAAITVLVLSKVAFNQLKDKAA